MQVRLFAVSLACFALAGCDYVSFLEANAEIEEMERREGLGLDPVKSVFPDDLPKIRSGKYRMTHTIDRSVVTKNRESCLLERTIKSAMMSVGSTLSCPPEMQSFTTTKSGYRYQATCDFPEYSGKQTVKIKVTGDLDTTFTVDRSTKFESGREETQSIRWEYRGAC